ncbi:YheC/YheD family protein [Mechercharimyces sp. CAU 1602]|uniref:YheC/YheD family endospore coat-associated protein n=1 Tax=Mechercharimyces sp. CAU 1602 TaxID=2973933 RepID=UPI0021632670|nr:YheC/YheD family protein [Mechercharimyces sp. CAU 1602]MCS1351632.1 YheC/YheD family protein [Mechercharimyces sp. CAU 1602]
MNNFHQQTKRLGVIVCKANHTPPFHEESYFKSLSMEAKKLGIQLIVFSPKSIDWNTRYVVAWQYQESSHRWVRTTSILPQIIYDRCYYINTKHFLSYKPYVTKIHQDPDCQILGRPLSGKWRTHEMLQTLPDLLPYLPNTHPWTESQGVLDFLRTHGSCLLKPNGGSHGRGIIAITSEGKEYLIRGRSQNNESFEHTINQSSALQTWLKAFIGSARYIYQPFLSLTTKDDRPFDVRILVQKNRNLQWSTTGMAVRLGKPHTLTSNLHGGGSAERIIPFLSKHYPKQMPDILTAIQWLSKHVPLYIEKQHGRLIELGLDVGIDRNGKVWLLEVNSKPGRTVFLRTGEKEVRTRSIELPIQYANTLLEGIVGGKQ